MENASKALIIAGGILIAILIISLGVYIFNNASILSSSYSDKLSQDELNKLNNKFLIYAKDLTPQEMVSIINLVKENNTKNVGVDENQIQVIIDNKIIDTLNVSQDWKAVIMEQAGVDNDPKYKFISVEYNDNNGRISKMSWRSTGGALPIDEEIATTCYHVWTEWSYLDDTNHQRTCRKCQQIQTQLHPWKDYTDNGNTHKKTCSICASTRDEPHDYTAYRDNGNGTHSRNCQKCSNVETKAHEWGNWITINGQTHKRTCQRCFSEERGNHVWKDWQIIRAGTCVMNEIQERLCSLCSQNERKNVARPDAHKWVAATCTIPQTCSYCRKTTGNPLGHSMGNWYTTRGATCTSSGTNRRDCTRNCGYYETGTIGALGHSMGSWRTEVRATCTRNGRRTRSCSRCGYTESQTIGKTGHSWTYLSYRKCS